MQASRRGLLDIPGTTKPERMMYALGRTCGILGAGNASSRSQISLRQRWRSPCAKPRPVVRGRLCTSRGSARSSKEIRTHDRIESIRK